MKIVTIDKENVKEINEIKSYLIENDKDMLSNIPLGENASDNQVIEIAYNKTNDKVTNVCFIDGVKDISFFGLKISNLSDGSIERNKNFIEEVTNYVLEDLDAETVAIFSKSKTNLYEDLGYEPLGECEGSFTYIKNRNISKKNEGIRI